MGKKTFRVGAAAGLAKRAKFAIGLIAVWGIITLYYAFRYGKYIGEMWDYYFHDVSLGLYILMMQIVLVLILGVFVLNYLYSRKVSVNIPGEIIVSNESIDINGSMEYHFNKDELASVYMDKTRKKGLRKMIIVTKDNRTLDFSLGLGKCVFKDAVMYQYEDLRETMNEWCDKNQVEYRSKL